MLGSLLAGCEESPGELIFINGKHIGGSDDLLELDAKGELDKLLAGEVSAT